MLELTNAGELAPRARLRLCLTEVFLPGDGAPSCDGDASQDRVSALARHTLVMRAFRAGRFEEGGKRLLELPPAEDATLAAWIAEDRAFLERSRNLPQKSPWLAAALSTAVPGLGRVYLGRWQDGLMSLLLVGAPAGLAAHGFHEQGRASVRGWVLGALATVLYVGNVYGSAVGALVYNDEQREKLLEEVDEAYRRRLDP